MPLPAPYGAGLEQMEWPADEMDVLPDNEIESRLAGLEGWSREGGVITKTFKNDDFVGSVRFVGALVEPAEDMGHHPDLSLSWDEVKVSITNHAAGGLTEADFELAKRIDGIAAG
jgi:4a-hydroxytetrahydrobiopterin dehydratase